MPNDYSALNAARANKKDEFYTQLDDIDKEMWHYKEDFRGKTVLCNCDDPYESNFFKHFAMHFADYGLKKLIATCYDGSPFAGQELSFSDIAAMEHSRRRKAYKVELTSVPDMNGDGAVDITDVEALLKSEDSPVTCLKKNGDFRNDECLELLEEADIVATNPPFSLFRQYVEKLIEYDKKFIILGSLSSATYKSVFSLIQEGKIWMGHSIHSGDREFRVPDSYPLEASGYRVDLKGRKFIRVKGVRWWTNLDYKERHEFLDLYEPYNEEKYPMYDNYDGIDIGKVGEIPKDYYGNMGVPINFLDVYAPEQFEIVGYGKGELAKSIGVTKNYRGRTDLCYTQANGKPKCPFGRMVIRRRQHAD